jgi:hypothetical protein
MSVSVTVSFSQKLNVAKSKLGFEKAKADFTCGKHQNEKANWGLRKQKLLLRK